MHRDHLIKLCEMHPKKLRDKGYVTFAVVTKDYEPVKEDLSSVFTVFLFTLFFENKERYLAFKRFYVYYSIMAYYLAGSHVLDS